MARLIPPAPINRPFVHNAAQPARPRKERRSQRIAEPVEIIDRFEVNIGDFVGSDTEKIKAAVAAAAALDKPAVIKLEHATTYTLTETIAVPKNYILIDLNQAVITRSTDYGLRLRLAMTFQILKFIAIALLARESLMVS
jgi:hypothetical protein